MNIDQQIESGLSHHRAGRLAEAEKCYRQVLMQQPNHADALHLFGALAGQVGRLDAAVELIQRAIRVKPDLAIAHSNLGNIYRDMGRLEEAIASFRRAILLKPDLADAHNNLGIALDKSGRLDEASASYREAIRLQPDLAEAHSNLASSLLGQGEHDDAIVAYRLAMKFKAEYHSDLLFVLNYLPALEPEAIFAEHLAWSDRCAKPLMFENIRYENERTPDRRLRIGYVSGDFRRHSVAHYLVPLLQHHDRQRLEICCYSNVKSPDDVTERMKGFCNVWRGIVGLNDEAAATMIRSDGIDILVELSGHTAENRLGVFARKPAPIQVTYLGYANTTGMTAIDYRLTDSLADPPGMTDALNVEKLWRLPKCAWCYQPLEEAPEVRPRGGGAITFGCFNAFAKINRNMVAIWAELLKCVPESRFLFKSAGAGESSSRQRLISQFAEHGIVADRIEMFGWMADSRAHLELYGRVDVALDTYPYHGTTTTCEALWMGVPVVTLAGRTHVSRVGVSLLTNVGLPELIAKTSDEYVSIAAELAKDRSRLDAMRAGLRDKIKSSPLVDGARFAADVECAYRQMWRTWCANARG